MNRVITALAMMILGALATAQEPQVLFYLPFEGNANAAYSAGEAPMGGRAATDALVYELEGQFEPGILGQGELFDKAGIEYLAEGNINQARGTLALWARINWDGTRDDIYCTFFGLKGWGLLYKYTDQTIMTFGWIKDDGQYHYGCTAGIEHWKAGEWHHIAITWDAPAGVRRLYLDGELGAEGEIPSAHPGEPRFVVGSSFGANPARAVLDELYIWDQPLAAEQITAVYQRGLKHERAWKVPVAATAGPSLPRPPQGTRPPLPEQIDWSLADAERKVTATRVKLCLNGFWRFKPAAGTGPDDGWCFLRVPGAWSDHNYRVRNAKFEPISKWGGKAVRMWERAWYERAFKLPDDWPKAQRNILGFDAARGVSEVFVNGEHVGRIREYERAQFDVTSLLKAAGENLVQVYVQALGAPRWGIMRGIDADVWLEARPGEGIPCLRHAALRPRVSRNCLEVEAYYDGEEGKAAVQVEVADAKGKVVKSETGPAQEVTGESALLTVPWRNAHCWTPLDPYLYTATVRLVDENGKVLDELYPERFGFRELTIQGGDFYLNGMKTHLKGQAAPPFGQVAFCASEDYIREWYRQLKEVGCFAVREYSGRWAAGYQCVWREKYYDIADEMGIIIFSHVPGAESLWPVLDDDRVKEGLQQRIADYVARYGNHACCAMWFQHFNTGAYTGDIRPDWMDGSHPPAKHPEMRTDMLARHAAMRWCEQQLRDIDRDSRPVFHHAAGDFGQVYTVMSYLDFDIPLQEREEWPSAWARTRRKPLMPVEAGFPCILSWYQERRGSLADVYASEPLFEEYAAPTLGDWAYDALPPEAMEIMKPGEWHCNLDALKYRLPSYMRLKEVWGERTLRSWRTWGISYCEHVEYRDCWEYQREPIELKLPGPKEFGLSIEPDEPTINRATKLTLLGQAMRRANMPVLAYIAGPPDNWAGKDHAFFAGEKFAKTLVVINDRYSDLKCVLRWTLEDAHGVRLTGGKEELRLAPGEIRFAGQAGAPVLLQAPEVEARTELSLKLTLHEGREKLCDDEFAIQVWPRPPRPEVGAARIGLLDAGHGTAQVLRAAGVRAEPVTARTDLSDLDALIIGADSLNAQSQQLLADLGLAAAQAHGLKVLVFEQTQAYGGLLLDDPNCRHVYLRASENPLLQGLSDADLADWRGQSLLTKPYPIAEDLKGHYPEEFWRWSNNGTVASFAFEKPQRGAFEVLADCSFDLMYTPLMTWRVGDGQMLLCQLDVTSRYGKDPVATLLVHRMIEWVARHEEPEPPGRMAYLGGEAGRALLAQLGCQAQQVESVAEAEGHGLLVLGDLPEAVGKELAGGKLSPTVFALPQAVPALAQALGLKTEAARFFKLSKPSEADEMLRGLSAADLYFKQWLEAPTLVGASVAGSEPVVVGHIKVGPSTLYFCGLDPAQVQGERQRAKAMRLVGTLLTNAAWAANADLPPLDLTVGQVEIGSAGSPYAVQALTYNPYKYRRW